MGHYTGLRAKVKIKPEYREAIRLLHDDDNASWEKLDIPNANKWAEFNRCGFIPFGVLAYMPDDFGEPFGENGGSSFDGEWWVFSCSLKNYNKEIQFFVDNVLTNIVEDVEYCQSLYEEYPYPRTEDYPFPRRMESPDEMSYWSQFCRNHLTGGASHG